MAQAASGGTAGGCVDDALTALDAALDVLASVDLHAVPVAALGAVVERLSVASRRLDAQQVRVTERFDASNAYALDGAASAAAWLRANLRVTSGAAAARVRVARRVGELPAMSAAFDAGEISREHVQVVTGAMARTPARRDTIAAAEPTFCQAARELDPAQLARVVTRWTHTVDPLGAVENEQAIHAQRFLAVSRTFDGAVAVDGLLAPEPGAVLLAALEALGATSYRGARAAGVHDRTAGQRRADALVDLARGVLDAGAAPEVAGVRPHLQVTVPARTLEAPRGRPGLAPAELDGVGPVSGEAARRIGCDASLTGVSVDASSMPVAYGRTARVVPPGLRRLVVARDGGCRFPGCDRPAAWSQAHHVVHWAHGGRTDLANLVLLCSHHHHCVHEGGFTIRGSPGESTFAVHRPDGSPLVDRGRAPDPS